MNTKPIPPYATLPSSGIDVEWSELLKGWKIDMGMDVNEFFKRNPDILEAVQARLPGVDVRNVSTRDILKRGVAEEILNQLILATDIPGEADRIFKGQRLRGVASGTLTAEARNKIYERAFKKGQLPKGTFINPTGGVRQTSAPFIENFHSGKQKKRLLEKAGITPVAGDPSTYYIDPVGDGTLLNQAGDRWGIQGSGKNVQLRNLDAFNDARRPINPRTGQVGTRYAAMKRFVDARKRGLIPQSALDSKLIAITQEGIAEYNNGNNRWGEVLKEGDPRRMTKEHIVSRNTWKALGLEGSAERASNVVGNPAGLAQQKSALESRLTAKKYQGAFSVDFDPTTGSLWIDPSEGFKPGIHGKSSYEIKPIDGKYNYNKILQQLEVDLPATKAAIGATDGFIDPRLALGGAGTLAAGTVAAKFLLGPASVALTEWSRRGYAEEAEKDPTFLNKFQRGVAEVEAATDKASLASAATGVGLVATPFLEGTSMAAGLLNTGIDVTEWMTDEKNRAELRRKIGDAPGWFLDQFNKRRPDQIQRDIDLYHKFN